MPNVNLYRKDSPVIILGIDPGLASTGVGVIEEQSAQSWKAIFHGATTTSAATPLPERLSVIHNLVESAIERHRPDVVAVESIFFARNVRSAVLMAHGRGAAILAASRRGIPVVEYSPLEIKQSVVGKGRAAKGQVAQMVMVLLHLAEPPASDHASDALACALCHAFRAGAAARFSVSAEPSPSARPNPSPASDQATEARKALLAQSMSRRRRRR